MCSCINVFAQTKLPNPDIRKQHYQNALLYFIKNTIVKKILIVENTNSNWVTAELMNLAESKGIEIEVLLFKGDQQKCAKHSIGYSHMEMVNYAFENSQLLSANESILVMDGRYKIINIDKIIKNIGNATCAFIPEVMRLKTNGLCDMRLYLVNNQIFTNYFWPRRFELSLDRQGWVESLYDQVLRSKKFYFSSFITLPRCVGVQGSTGAKWDGNNVIYYYIKSSLLSLFGLLKY